MSQAAGDVAEVEGDRRAHEVRAVGVLEALLNTAAHALAGIRQRGSAREHLGAVLAEAAAREPLVDVGRHARRSTRRPSGPPSSA